MIGRKRYCTVTVSSAFSPSAARAGLAAFIIYDQHNGAPLRFKASCYIEAFDADLAEFMAVNYAMTLLVSKGLHDCDINVISTESQIVYDQLKKTAPSTFYREVVADVKQWQQSFSGQFVFKKIVTHKQAKKQTAVERVNAWCVLEAQARARVATR